MIEPSLENRFSAFLSEYDPGLRNVCRGAMHTSARRVNDVTGRLRRDQQHLARRMNVATDNEGPIRYTRSVCNFKRRNWIADSEESVFQGYIEAKCQATLSEMENINATSSRRLVNPAFVTCWF